MLITKNTKVQNNKGSGGPGSLNTPRAGDTGDDVIRTHVLDTVEWAGSGLEVCHDRWCYGW